MGMCVCSAAPCCLAHLLASCPAACHDVHQQEDRHTQPLCGMTWLVSAGWLAGWLATEGAGRH
jgi:hypothetical protein